MTHTCSLCCVEFTGIGSNPAPLSEGRCCQHCDDLFVIPARIHLAQGRQRQRGLARLAVIAPHEQRDQYQTILNFIQIQIAQIKMREAVNALTPRGTK